MHYYDIKNSRDLVSVDEILSLYLWGKISKKQDRYE